MGYKPQKRVFHLQFESYPGLKVDAKGTTLGRVLDISNTDIDFKDGSKATLDAFSTFLSCIITWNVEHPEPDESTEDGVCVRCGLSEDDPLPTTVEYALCLEAELLTAMLMGWLMSMTRVSLPKGLNFNGGAPNGQERNPLGGMTREELMQMLAENQSPTES